MQTERTELYSRQGSSDTRENFERLAREIELKTCLPLAIEAVYRYRKTDCGPCARLR